MAIITLVETVILTIIVRLFRLFRRRGRRIGLHAQRQGVVKHRCFVVRRSSLWVVVVVEWVE